MTITTVVFDAYGTLFDTSAATRKAASEPGSEVLADIWQELSAEWRRKQLEYTWLRAITGHHVDFWRVTQDGLDWAMEAHGLSHPELRERLLALYWELEAYPEVPKVLSDLQGSGIRTAILSNGSREMLAGAVSSADLRDLLDAVLSVDSVGVFKPSGKVYDLVQQEIGARPEEVLFVSSNGWDVGSAAAYGFQTLWVNRAGNPVDRLAATPDRIAHDLGVIPDLLAKDAARNAAPETFRTSDGLSLSYRVEGEGPVLLCLSGLTRNMSDFDYVARDFSDRARIVRMDYRGRGASDFDPDYKSYNIPREAQDATELLDHLGIERAAILGTSRGGLIAMTLAATAKDRLKGACLVDIGPELAPEGLVAIFGYLGLPPKARTLEEGTDALMATQAPRFPGVSRARWREHAGRIWTETPDGLKLNYDPRLRDAMLEQAEAAKAADEEADLWPLFDAFEGLPLALIHGANSDLLSDATATEMQRRRPDMTYAAVPDRGHVPFLDEPESRRVLAEFIGAIS